MSSPKREDSPGVQVPPPLFYVGAAAVGLGLERWAPLPFLPVGWVAVSGIVGRLAILVGMAIVASGMVSFARARTAIVPNRSASRLVEAGPYRFTRNPMYLGLAVAYLGFALSTRSLWVLLLFPAVLLTIQRYVIRREERYLRSAFGQAYVDYCARVRRWI